MQNLLPLLFVRIGIVTMLKSYESIGSVIALFEYTNLTNDNTL